MTGCASFDTASINSSLSATLMDDGYEPLIHFRAVNMFCVVFGRCNSRSHHNIVCFVGSALSQAISTVASVTRLALCCSDTALDALSLTAMRQALDDIIACVLMGVFLIVMGSQNDLVD